MESMLENFYDLLCQVVFSPLFGSIIVDLFLGFFTGEVCLQKYPGESWRDGRTLTSTLEGKAAEHSTIRESMSRCCC